MRDRPDVDFDRLGFFQEENHADNDQMAWLLWPRRMADSGLLLSEEGKKRAGVFIVRGWRGHSVDE